MSLSSLGLDAFKQVALERSFSQAAKKLNLTQSALSQRILNLEQEIGTALFIREPQGILMTETGKRLLRYCTNKEALEEEFWSELKAEGELGGVIRIGSFSSVSRSILLPVLAPLIKDHPRLQLDLRTKEIRQLPSALMSGEVDFILMTEPLEKQGIENHLLGHEENVLIRSTLKKSIQDVYLDHDEHDPTTLDFLELQGKSTAGIRRSYLDDVDSIIEGVRLGIGMSVVPRHLIHDIRGIEIVKGQKPLKVPVYLIYYHQSFYSKLQGRVREEILEKFRF